MRQRLLFLGLLGAVACDRDPGLRNREYMPDMVDSVAFESFSANPNTRDGRTFLRPPRGTLPRGFERLHLDAGPAQAAIAAQTLTSPLSDNDVVRARGETIFLRTCSPCHGQGGEGDGLVATRFPRPPSLVAPHARALADGQIFHIATFGQGVMPGHGQQLMPRDRWAAVAHIRRLQSAAGPAAPASPVPTTKAAP